MDFKSRRNRISGTKQNKRKGICIIRIEVGDGTFQNTHEFLKSEINFEIHIFECVFELNSIWMLEVSGGEKKFVEEEVLKLNIQ